MCGPCLRLRRRTVHRRYLLPPTPPPLPHDKRRTASVSTLSSGTLSRGGRAPRRNATRPAGRPSLAKSPYFPLGGTALRPAHLPPLTGSFPLFFSRLSRPAIQPAAERLTAAGWRVGWGTGARLRGPRRSIRCCFAPPVLHILYTVYPLLPSRPLNCGMPPTTLPLPRRTRNKATYCCHAG